MTKILVTISPPTPNGGLHLGHIAGPFLSADVYARTQRLLGHEAVLLSYSDDYQSYLMRKARERGETETTTCTKFAVEIEATLRRAAIGIDHFMYARDNETFASVVTDYVSLLETKGLITQETRPVPYCPPCRQHGYEAFARGKCSHCGHPSDASQCEFCATAPDVKAMASLTCTVCQRPTAWRYEDLYVFNLAHFRSFLQEYYARTPMRPQLAAFIERTLVQESLRWPITRPGECGIPTRWRGGQIVHTWFSGLAGYRAAFDEYAAKIERPELVREYWHNPEAVFAHFLGFDCSFSHAIAYRAILSVTETPPTNAYYYTNAFLELDSKDFSTSRGHAIWVNDALDVTSADTLRLYLASLAPENERRNFVTDDFDAWRKNYDRELRELEQDLMSMGAAFKNDEYAALETFKKRWRNCVSLERFSMAAMAGVVLDLWEHIRSLYHEGVNVRLLVAGYAAMAAALQPDLSARLGRCVGMDLAILLRWLREEDGDLREAVSQALQPDQSECSLACK